MATLPGEPPYSSLGFAAVERVTAELPARRRLPLVRMSRPLT